MNLILPEPQIDPDEPVGDHNREDVGVARGLLDACKNALDALRGNSDELPPCTAIEVELVLAIDKAESRLAERGK